MLKKYITKTKYTEAVVSVGQKKTPESTSTPLTGKLNIELKIVEIDLSMYRRLRIEDMKILGEALIELSKEAEKALKIENYVSK